MGKNRIKNIVEKTIKKYGHDPFEICSMKDIIVKTMDMPNKLKGYTTTYRRIPIIFINSNLTYQQRKFVCLHELGHILLKHEDNILFKQTYTLDNGCKEEKEANYFAIQFMVNGLDKDELRCLNMQQFARVIGTDLLTIKNFYP